MKRAGLKRSHSARLRQHIVPVLVWLVALAAVGLLFHQRTQRFQVLGLAQGQVRQISAPCDGRLKIVSVELFEKVDKGQILAVLDDAELTTQIDTICAEIEHLMSQLLSIQDTMVTEAANLQTDRIAAQRRFYVDVDNAKLRVLVLKTLIETDRITLQDLGLEVKIMQELLEKQAIAPYSLEKAETLYNTLAKTVEENQHLLAQAEQNLKHAQQRRDEFAWQQPLHPSVDTALEPIRKQITVQEKLIDELLIQRKVLTITSPLDGVVVQIMLAANMAASRRPGEAVVRKPGEVVLAGDPILALAETEPREIIAYASETQLGRVKQQMMVELIKNTEPRQIAGSQVVYIGPLMELMPQRLWRNPNIPQWGRPILIKIPPGLKLIPGELVGVRGL